MNENTVVTFGPEYQVKYNEYQKRAEEIITKKYNKNTYEEVMDLVNPSDKKAINAYIETYAELGCYSDKYYYPPSYNRADDSSIHNWALGKLLLDKDTKNNGYEERLQSFQSSEFQNELFNQFFNQNNENDYSPNLNSGFSVDGNSILTPEDSEMLRNWLKNGGNEDLTPSNKNVSDNFNNAQQTEPVKIDPLLIDLDGDGIETTTVSRGTYFDHQSDGFAEASAWVGEDDGILAFDKNNNGFIDNGNEIFGDNYIKSDGTKATSGFDALSDFDSNNDGVINALDEKFSQLKILKGDDSLITLEQAGIVSINLNSSASNQVDENGNTQLSSGTYTKSDGTTGQIGDYYLQNDKKDSFATEWVEVPEDVLQLPDIKGQGTVYSLHQAIARDTSGELKELVEDFINSTNKNDKIALINEILYKWTGANQIEPDSRGSNIDAQQLYVLEKFMGENFIGVDGTGNPNNQACNLLNNAYAMLKNTIYAQLQSKTELKPLYDLLDLQYNSSTHKYGYNIDAIQQYIDDKININSTSGKELLTDFVQTFIAMGLDETSNYNEFYNHYVSMGDDYKFLMDTADKVLIYGDDNANSIEGTAQQEAVFAGAGNDTIYTRQGNDLVYGGEGDDYIDTCEGDDIIYGENGNDTINAGYGNDTIYGGAGNDSIETGNGDDVVYAGDGNDYIYNFQGSDYIDGGDGDDTIVTRYENDTLVGGKGNDYFSDNLDGDELFIFNLGDGNDTIYNNRGNDTIQFGEGITKDNIIFTGDIVNLVIRFTNSNDSITIENCIGDENFVIENFKFSDGTTLSYEEVKNLLVTQGTDGNDNIIGSNASEKIYGFGGDDTIDARNGNDTIYGGAGNDTIETGDGDDVVYAGDGNDYIYNFQGSDYIDGGDGDDTIVTRYENDTLVGGKGNDYFSDNLDGDELFIFNLGDGNDTIYNNRGNDTIQFGEGITKDNIIFQGYTSDLIITFKNSNDSIRIENCLINDDFVIENFKFSDGTTLNYEEVKKLLVTKGTNGNDNITGSNASEKIYGFDGDDTIDAGSGNDTIYGGTGNDYITTFSGNDVIYGEDGNDYIFTYDGPNFIDGGNGDDTIFTREGNDTIIGGKGNDALTDNFGGDELYIFNLGDGIDTIQDYLGNDKILFKDTVNTDNIAFFMNSNGYLYIDYGKEAGQDVIQLNYQDSANYKIEMYEVETSSGESLFMNSDDINKLIQDMTAYASENDITINSVQDVKQNADLMNLVNSAWAA